MGPFNGCPPLASLAVSHAAAKVLEKFCMHIWCILSKLNFATTGQWCLFFAAVCRTFAARSESASSAPLDWF